MYIICKVPEIDGIRCISNMEEEADEDGEGYNVLKLETPLQSISPYKIL